MGRVTGQRWEIINLTGVFGNGIGVVEFALGDYHSVMSYSEAVTGRFRGTEERNLLFIKYHSPIVRPMKLHVGFKLICSVPAGIPPSDDSSLFLWFSGLGLDQPVAGADSCKYPATLPPRQKLKWAAVTRPPNPGTNFTDQRPALSSLPQNTLSLHHGFRSLLPRSQGQGKHLPLTGVHESRLTDYVDPPCPKLPWRHPHVRRREIPHPTPRS